MYQDSYTVSTAVMQQVRRPLLTPLRQTHLFLTIARGGGRELACKFQRAKRAPFPVGDGQHDDARCTIAI